MFFYGIAALVFVALSFALPVQERQASSIVSIPTATSSIPFSTSASSVTTFIPSLSSTPTATSIASAVSPSSSASSNSSEKLVFCHFMIGVVSNRASAADFDSDMQRAKEIGIDAFALNIGTDSYTDEQLGYAYQSAENNDMKVFLSFDFNWWSTSDTSAIGAKIANYASQAAQLTVNGKIFVSSFAGDGLDVDAVRQAAGVAIYFAPNFQSENVAPLDGALNWMAWPNDGSNKAPNAGSQISVLTGDESYYSALSVGNGYVAPVSPWFSTHFGPEVSYSKNWVFPGDLLWYDRWEEILNLQPEFVEIITWNDYGESHYIGPLSSPHTDDGSSKWVNDMPHDAWVDMAKPYIAAYKAGSQDVASFITEDQIVYWYRTAPKDLDCDSTDTTMVAANNASGNYFNGRPNGYESMTDSVFVATLLTSPGSVSVNTGGTLYTYDAPTGSSSFSIPFNIGAQSFSLSRNNAEVMSATSLKEIKNECPCGIYNFNAYVGSVPEAMSDALQADGLSQLTNGLHVDCAASPSLPATPPSTVAPTQTSTVSVSTASASATLV